VPILEDDYDSELRYEGPPIAALKTLDRAGGHLRRDVLEGALPGPRGRPSSPRGRSSSMMLARWNADVTTNVVAQAALAHLLATGGPRAT
jgi:GntR family transcriptional regulator/MocR family aminotransferase